jgi:rhamnogalacturonyl hydrolase YesR|uniref:Uncharacterized protein n=1 Tax=Picea sitchensis TaxID=3332 RepID=A0A6B9XUQ8_PICSI|nr:hypothetical protein Q903MT_gene6678 [Picea sitchensis]
MRKFVTLTKKQTGRRFFHQQIKFRSRESSATAGILSSFLGAVSTGGESEEGGPDLRGRKSTRSKEPPYHRKMGAVAMCCV